MHLRYTKVAGIRTVYENIVKKYLDRYKRGKEDQRRLKEEDL